MSEEDDSNNVKDEKPTTVVGKTSIRLSGDVDGCGHCKEGDQFFKENAPAAGVNYEYYNIESEKGKQIADNLDSGPGGSYPIPAIEYCKEIKDGDNVEEKCDYIQGFEKKDWDTKLNYKQPNDVDEEIDEIFGNDD